jgi:hypothetical protein
MDHVRVETKLLGFSPRVDRGCRMVNAADPYGNILGFLDRSR